MLKNCLDELFLQLSKILNPRCFLQINHLEKDKKTLEERIIALQEERVVMQTNLNKLELERDDYIRELREVTAERQSLEHRVADLEDTLR